MTSIIEGIRSFLMTCPALKDGKINIDYLPENEQKSGVEYSVDSLPGEETIKPYIDGAALCQHQFTIRSVTAYGADVMQQLTNSSLFEDLAAWLREQSRKRNLPELPAGLTARSINAQSSGYLAAVSASSAKYQIQCQLVYYRKGGR